MKTFEFEVRHDNGTATIRVQADDIKAAKAIVTASEKCPESALGWWRIVPTAKQIKKTKSLLRGI